MLGNHSSGQPRERPRSNVEIAREACADPGTRQAAKDALALFRSYCAQSMPRIPGMDTWIRMAIRVHLGKSIEEAAAREYSHRWLLFLRAWSNHTESRARGRFIHPQMVYPAPHLLGQ